MGSGRSSGWIWVGTLRRGGLDRRILGIVGRLGDEADPATVLDAGRVRCTYRWIVEGDRVLGAIASRDERCHIGSIQHSGRRRAGVGWSLGRSVECSTRRVG